MWRVRRCSTPIGHDMTVAAQSTSMFVSATQGSAESEENAKRISRQEATCCHRGHREAHRRQVRDQCEVSEQRYDQSRSVPCMACMPMGPTDGNLDGSLQNPFSCKIALASRFSRVKCPPVQTKMSNLQPTHQPPTTFPFSDSDPRRSNQRPAPNFPIPPISRIELKGLMCRSVAKAMAGFNNTPNPDLTPALSQQTPGCQTLMIRFVHATLTDALSGLTEKC